MAPEQLEGKEADARTDIFAFGAVLYEMATGRKAFAGASQASLISAIMTAEPPPISTVQPMTPPALDRVVRTCLAKDPEDRWQSAGDVAKRAQVDRRGLAPAWRRRAVTSRGRRASTRLDGPLCAAFVAAAFVLLPSGVARPPHAPGFDPLHALLPPGASVCDQTSPLSPDGRHWPSWSGEGPRPSGSETLDGDVGATAARAPRAACSPSGRPTAGRSASSPTRKLEEARRSPAARRRRSRYADYGRGASWGPDDGVILFSTAAREASCVSRPAGALQSNSRSSTLHGATPPIAGRSFLPDGRRFLVLGLPGTFGEASRFRGVARRERESPARLHRRLRGALFDPGHAPLRSEGCAAALRRFRSEGQASRPRAASARLPGQPGRRRAVAGFGVTSTCLPDDAGDLAFVAEPRTSSRAGLVSIGRQAMRQRCLSRSPRSASRFLRTERRWPWHRGQTAHQATSGSSTSAAGRRSEVDVRRRERAAPVWSPDGRIRLRPQSSREARSSGEVGVPAAARNLLDDVLRESARLVARRTPDRPQHAAGARIWDVWSAPHLAT